MAPWLPFKPTTSPIRLMDVFKAIDWEIPISITVGIINKDVEGVNHLKLTYNMNVTIKIREATA